MKDKTLNDDEFEKQFRNCVLDSELFTHEAHIRIAWIYLKKYGFTLTLNNLPNDLLNYCKSLNSEDKFNLSTTTKSIKLINRQMCKKENDFNLFIIKNQDLLLNFKKLIEKID